MSRGDCALVPVHPWLWVGARLCPQDQPQQFGGWADAWAAAGPTDTAALRGLLAELTDDARMLLTLLPFAMEARRTGRRATLMEHACRD